MRSVVVTVTLFCVSSLVVAKNLIPRQTAAAQQGGAVLFYAAFQGQLRELEFNPILFNDVLVNQGSAYSNDSGVFIAPVTGIYQFVFAAQLCRGNHNNIWYFMVNGKQGASCHAQVSGSDTTLSTCYCLEDLKKGDPVWMKQLSGTCAWASTSSKTITFSGVLLAREGASTLGGEYSSCPLTSLDHMRTMASSSEHLKTSLALALLCRFH
ncbi:hypothetical protein JOQ06_004008 [Pogonophryne albipinna]|uniref:C1q domain-containing protein n=1 Tax=Pogonophryne albipinna TaxID=1090488 RepID=A0AAD6ACP2_9TELE|nr:hypothetical protein JOQ06_004008 [Pogonophryne albipinna]